MKNGIDWLRQQSDEFISCIITSVPGERSSEYCTLFSTAYFFSFTDRQNEWQKWTPVAQPIAPLFMQVPDLERYALLEFDEIIRDEEFVYQGKIYQ